MVGHPDSWCRFELASATPLLFELATAIRHAAPSDNPWRLLLPNSLVRW